MRLAGRLSAAIEILTEIGERHRPAALALADWGRSHRFAGSGDRSAIGTLVYDAMRRKTSIAWAMGEDTPRALAVGTLRWVWRMPADEVAALCDGSQHAPTPLSEREVAALARELDAIDMPDWAAADVPEWLYADFAAYFGEQAVAEGRALSGRAPVDLRVNPLKADRARVLKALEKYHPQPTPHSPLGVRIAAPGPREKHPQVEAESAHGKGWYEVQDEASQIAVMLSGAGPRLQVLDLCAGSGGKTLGMAALMQNTGQIHAYDSDKQRLRPIFERLKRAGARNVQVHPAGEEAALEPLRGRMDVVFADAPCSGSGVWRRRPDAKWRLTPAALATRIAEQHAVLDLAAPLLRPGGRLIYATCSIIAAENREQIAAFISRHPSFTEADYRACWQAGTDDKLRDACLIAHDNKLASAADTGGALQLTPNCHATDGFYVSILYKQ